MISKTIGFRGFAYFQTHLFANSPEGNHHDIIPINPMISPTYHDLLTFSLVHIAGLHGASPTSHRPMGALSVVSAAMSRISSRNKA